MARVTILYWQNIPSLVEVRDGTAVHKLQLSRRFQELIDMVAMRKELTGSDAYLEHWRKGPVEERLGEAEALARAIADGIEARFDAIRTAAMADIEKA